MIKILSKALRKIFPARLKSVLKIYERKRRLTYILHRLDNLVRYNRLDHFRSVDIETITACNRRCWYCPNSRFDRGLIENKRLMDSKLFCKIIDELYEINFRGRITPNFYGEPLLDERLSELMAYARQRLPSAYIVVFTNGDFLNLDLYKRLVSSGVNKFVISQHGLAMPAGIREVMGYREDREKQPVEIRYIIMKNKSCLLNRGGLVNSESIIKIRYCYKGTENLVIDYDGNIILCCNDYFSSVKFGNVQNEKISEIWNKSAYKKIRKELEKGIFRLDICERCTAGA